MYAEYCKGQQVPIKETQKYVLNDSIPKTHWIETEWILRQLARQHSTAQPPSDTEQGAGSTVITTCISS